MKKLLLEWGIYLTVATLYAAWRYRLEIWQTWEEFDEEILSRAQYEKAVDATLRSIRRLPETPEGGEH